MPPDERPLQDATHNGRVLERLAGGVQRARKRPIVVLVATLVTVVAAVGTVGGGASWAYGRLHDLFNPHAQDYQNLAALEPGLSRAFVEDRFGKPRKTTLLCATGICPPQIQQVNPTVSRYGSNAVALQAVYVRGTLEWYAVTLLSGDVEPPMTWLDHDLGKLGRTTYREAFAVPQIQPTDTDMFLGPQSTAYVELFAGGAPAHYEGLFLGSAPSGLGDVEFDRSAAEDMERLNDRSDSNDHAFDAMASDRFRSHSEPNTYGRFVDSGPMAKLFEDAQFTRTLLYTFYPE